LLCNECNWEFVGFAIPGTVSAKGRRKKDSAAPRTTPVLPIGPENLRPAVLPEPGTLDSEKPEGNALIEQGGTEGDGETDFRGEMPAEQAIHDREEQKSFLDVGHEGKRRHKNRKRVRVKLT